jgi:hypothetical protein
VDTVMVDGQIVLKDRRLLRLNKAEAVERLRASLLRDPTPQERERSRLAEELMPHVRRFYRDWGSGPRQAYATHNSAV